MRSADVIVERRWAITNVVRPRKQFDQRLLDQLLAFRVQIARRFVQDQDLRVREDGPRNGQRWH